jgi:hypothetical protein
MVPGSQVLYKAVTERRVLHDGHAAPAQHVGNAIQRQTDAASASTGPAKRSRSTP